jgi:hypothetical protein
MVVCVPPGGSISSSVRPTVYARCPGGDDNSIACVDTQLCVSFRYRFSKIRYSQPKVPAVGWAKQLDEE